MILRKRVDRQWKKVQQPVIAEGRYFQSLRKRVRLIEQNIQNPLKQRERGCNQGIRQTMVSQDPTHHCGARGAIVMRATFYQRGNAGLICGRHKTFPALPGHGDLRHGIQPGDTGGFPSQHRTGQDLGC
ncbi:hypothetical protein HP15_3722 [Marinobacter adhaerens HP15]|uniref:Uncharacterized protein n=1 Tax=Marinobacter adhaerens (strain DSM 23420 / HP15) TaxID=225937 RepID=E4PI00_MARAH|nr:hypothetical protein HP15_3722 [Marinobacter adhaerens HP15]